MLLSILECQTLSVGLCDSLVIDGVGLEAFAAAQSDPGLTRFGYNESIANMTWGAIGIDHTVTGHDCLRMQRLDFIERSKPLAPSLFVALREIKVRVVIDAISRYDQTNGRHIQRS